MKYSFLGQSGLAVSQLGLGCNNFGARTDADLSQRIVDAALDQGVTFFDTADTYTRGASEEILGRALGSRRDQAVIATKVGGPMGPTLLDRGASRRHVLAACEASLRRLGTDYIDVYYVHFPDVNTPIDETLGALDDLVRSGKVRYLGCSNFAGWMVADAVHLASKAHATPFVTNQVEWSLLERGVEAEIVPACQRFGLGIVAYFPLAAGVLTGKYRRGQPIPDGTRIATTKYFKDFLTPRRLDIVEDLIQFATDRDLSLLTVALSWIATRPGLASVLVGASSPEQLESNLTSLGWSPTPDDIAALDALLARD